MQILQSIKGHKDLSQLDAAGREQLCREIRQFLVSCVSKTGGHLASNLGVVELTVAIETVFDTEKDRLVFDVGHQSYIHKLLTGRQADFAALRQFGGIAGFPKPSESQSDAFVAGHASSSVSIALGMARARHLSGENYNVIALLGDGAATGGMAYEGLNDAGVSNEPMIVILNDNAMSIDHNVGAMASHLSKLRTKEKYLGMKKRYRHFLEGVPGGRFLLRLSRSVKDGLRRMLVPNTIFEGMGFTYFGPVDGHDTENLITLLRIARDMKRPVVLHVLTQKGRGYTPAQEHPKLFHGIGKFNPETGEPEKKNTPTYSDAFGNTMVELAGKNKRLCAITAAMPGGTGLLDFKKKYPNRLLDVGIAEEHAVSMAGGLAKQGAVPVVAIYSTFLQRAYDMILQDVAMQNLHVVLAVDRAGLVGEDGETHHGVFDVGFLRQAPNFTVLCPGSLQELSHMLCWAVEKHNGPVALRYPRGGNGDYADSAWQNCEDVAQEGALTCHRQGDSAVLITYGTMLQNTMNAAALLQEQGISVTVLRLLSVSPLPVEKILSYLKENEKVFVVEDACGGICRDIAYEIGKRKRGCAVYGLDLGKDFVTHGAIEKLYQSRGLDASGIANYVQEVLTVEK